MLGSASTPIPIPSTNALAAGLNKFNSSEPQAQQGTTAPGGATGNGNGNGTSTDTQLLEAILLELRNVKLNQAQFEHKLEALALAPASPFSLQTLSNTQSPPSLSHTPPLESTSPLSLAPIYVSAPLNPTASPSLPARNVPASSPYSQRVILTTYPNQVGISPVPLKWGAPSAMERGPVIASRHALSIKKRNAIGAYAGSYSVYRALACAQGLIDPNHRPDYTNTEPPIDIKWNPSWDDKSKIVSIDPYGHLAPQVFKSYFDAGLDIRPTISITKAHIKLLDMDEAVRSGALEVDGKIVVKTPTEWINANRAASTAAKTKRDEHDIAAQHIEHAAFDAGVELNVNKAALEPVWYLPGMLGIACVAGIAQRFGITEGALRRSLFEDTGGAFPELMTRPDLKVFLPPIGGMTVYIFGPVEYISDESKELTLRVHDECSGSDVFGSDICTCRPYLIYGLQESIRCAQRGGVGIVIYFRKEGRALGEVTKYLVYNARKRGGDNAAHYFKRTEDVSIKQIAGVKDMRFQALMPDVLHWLGVKKIDNMISMSDLKYNAIVESGIPIHKRYEIPEDLIPPDSRVEIDAKIAAGYFSTTSVTNLEATAGRLWEEVQH
ncbi:BZ3500_MvSof-1268-A1-R1_Chr3-3g06529 [Microbotryum saponariae]|uniref:BZ3500_MvSof-1268-A1-R1_Chr3-3g06529 protein n=1 Tax=Microbotryum saponariae TaxID=289078 RepID=A0A2X0NG93_9BASI|nr:BZ3500_MvSof-1268-A1-R1_Chr3-3g06529 [Microbotryum saponariae]SDA04496.1 BZ3501_MvSof-1269-A2-R1_Chr3-2g06216 [Microbotryum saponariae]